jgi:hypothetical protein
VVTAKPVISAIVRSVGLPLFGIGRGEVLGVSFNSILGAHEDGHF